jgi:twinkle protein
MASVIPDTIDFAAYERDTEVKAKVRSGADFGELLADYFDPEKPRVDAPAMFSTKLRSRLQFRPGELTVWAGYNGHRKSMFTGQVALDLAAQGQRVLIVSLEMSPVDTLVRMGRQALATTVMSARQARAFASWTDGRVWLFDHVGRIDTRRALAVLRYFAEECGGQHVFLDSMMMVCGSEESLDEQKQFTTDLVRAAQEYRLHLHLVAHCRKPASGAEDKPPTKYDLRGSAAISDQAQNVVTVWSNKAKAAKLEINPQDEEALQQPDARVSVEKQRNGAWEGAVKLWWCSSSLRFTDERQTAVEPYRLKGFER